MTAAGGRTDRYSRSPAGSTVVQASAFDLAYVTGTEDAPTRGRYAVVYDFRVGEHARREFVPLAEPAGLYRHVAAGGANWWSRAYEVTGPAGRTNEGDVCDPDRREVGDGTGTETRIVVAHGLRCVTTRSTLEDGSRGTYSRRRHISGRCDAWHSSVSWWSWPWPPPSSPAHRFPVAATVRSAPRPRRPTAGTGTHHRHRGRRHPAQRRVRHL
ncbi:hypothetical protein BRD17_05890 [Halobacteriales archaeon SW_7_68_16]|nr:MAG: hypothetical protein BRD17_05890 [Halobacteriales archaeon SW_7_68_16]